MGLDMSIIKMEDTLLESQMDFSIFRNQGEESDEDLILGEVENFYKSLKPE